MTSPTPPRPVPMTSPTTHYASALPLPPRPPPSPYLQLPPRHQLSRAPATHSNGRRRAGLPLLQTQHILPSFLMVSEGRGRAAYQTADTFFITAALVHNPWSDLQAPKREPTPPQTRNSMQRTAPPPASRHMSPTALGPSSHWVGWPAWHRHLGQL